MNEPVQQYPLLCGFRELAAGRGFIAAVSASGRALATQEADGQWWIYGVNPGAIAQSGATLQEAHANLRSTFSTYLADVAAEAQDFAAFRAEVERFFRATNESTAAEWTAAVVAVRAGRIGDLPGVPRAPAESYGTILITLLSVVEEIPASMAA